MRLEPAATRSMVSIVLTRSILPVLSLIAALGCHKELLAPTGPASADGLSVALRVTYAALRVGQSDSITVTLTNTKPDTVSLQVGGCPLVFYVQDSNGAAVVPAGGAWICADIVQLKSLPPGQPHL